jgi:hypothetical protein
MTIYKNPHIFSETDRLPDILRTRAACGHEKRSRSLDSAPASSRRSNGTSRMNTEDLKLKIE